MDDMWVAMLRTTEGYTQVLRIKLCFYVRPKVPSLRKGGRNEQRGRFFPGFTIGEKYGASSSG